MRRKSLIVTKQISLRIVEERTERNQRSAAKAKIRRKRESRLSNGHASQQSRFINKENAKRDKGKTAYVDMNVPELLELRKNPSETAEFLRDIRRIALHQRKPLRLHFENTKTIDPPALLLLLAHIHRCRLTFGQNHVTGTYPEEKRLERMMHLTGFFKLLGVRSRLKNIKQTYPLEYIEFVSEDRTTQGTARRLRENLFGESVQLSLTARKQLTRVIDEAMLNAGQHAYPLSSAKLNQQRGRWWLVGHVTKRQGRLTVLFCDLGVGIPETLPKRYAMERIRAALAILPGIKPNDAQMVQAGMTIGRTRTNLQNRGKGLNDLRRFVDEAGEGQLHIFSRKGHYHYEPGGRETLKNMDYAIGGTLIQWSVPLAKVSNWTGGDEDGQNDDN